MVSQLSSLIAWESKSCTPAISEEKQIYRISALNEVELLEMHFYDFFFCNDLRTFTQSLP